MRLYFKETLLYLLKYDYIQNCTETETVRRSLRIGRDYLIACMLSCAGKGVPAAIVLKLLLFRRGPTIFFDLNGKKGKITGRYSWDPRCVAYRFGADFF